MLAPMTISLGEELRLEDLEAVLGPRPPRIELCPVVLERARASRRVVDEVLERGETVYGLNTGFGALAGTRIDPSRLEELQRNLVLSHAGGLGEPLAEPLCRLMLLLRIQSLALGFSGVREELLTRLQSLYNADLIPVIPSQGSVGASGDLAPLAHMALPLLGLGEVWAGGRSVPASRALAGAGLAPLVLAAKEGLALINGTQCMTAIGVATWLLARDLVKVADIAAALAIEALRGSAKPFDEQVQLARQQAGQLASAANLRLLLGDSEIVVSHADCPKVQDPYSLRCVPQVHGAVRDALAYSDSVLRTEVNAATDNPLVFPDGRIVSAGNFHGQPVSQALDFLGIAMSTLGAVSERRIENLVNPSLSGLPAFLAKEPGVESGLMVAQVAAASLVSENKTLAHPASVDSIPTSANQEDHVSMGVTAARHAQAITSNSGKVLGIELLAGAEALGLDRTLKAGKGVEAAFAAVRERISASEGDRILAPLLAEAERLASGGELIRAVEAAVGPLQ
ncbi:MAG: histidine ammonia-lyase [Planctomycetota bacterium]